MRLHFSFSRPSLARPAATAILGLAMLTGLAAPLAHAADMNKGTFKAVEGDVQLVRGDVQSLPKPGSELRQSDRIRTGANSATAVTLTDGTVITLGPNSDVSLKEMHYEPTTQNGNVVVEVLRGSLRMITGLIAKKQPDNVKVTTPTSVIGVRGTDFIVEVNE